MSLITAIKKIFSKDLLIKYQPSQKWIDDIHSLPEETKQQGTDLLLQAMNLLNNIQPDFHAITNKIQQAANHGNIEAMEKLADCYEGGNPAVAQNHKKALEWYLKAASLGSDTATTKVGKLFHLNTHPKIKQDFNTALTWYKKAQDTDANAMYYIGSMYQTGQGVPESKQHAKQWLQKAIELNHTKAMLLLGDIYVKENDFSNARKCYQQAYELMDIEADSSLKRLALYETLDDFPYLLQQAQQGDAEAACKVGHYYFLGIGREPDSYTAAGYYYQALEAGDGEAAFHFALLSEMGVAKVQLEGQDGFVDQAIATKSLFELALKNKYPTAIHNRGISYIFGDNGFPEDRDLGVGLLQEAAMAGYLPSIAFLRNLQLPDLPSYMVLDPSIKDPEKEFYWSESYTGEKPESNFLRFIKEQIALQEKQLIDKDFNTINQQAKQGDTQAMLLLGMMYGTGTQVEQNSQQAFAWYFKAANADNVEAMYRLGMLQLIGQEVEESAQPLFWLNRAADFGNMLAERITHIARQRVNLIPPELL